MLNAIDVSLKRLDRRARYHQMPQMNFDDPFWTQHVWTGITVIAAVVVLISSLADRRRQKRTNIEDVGFMPWTLMTILAMLLTVVAAALAIKSGELF